MVMEELAMRTPLSENTVINDRYVVQKAINFKAINQMNYLCVDQENGKIVLVKEFFPVYADRNEDGKLEGDIENYKGVVLPETGAEGTFFLITCGALLTMLAVVFMVTRKKMSIYED